MDIGNFHEHESVWAVGFWSGVARFGVHKPFHRFQGYQVLRTESLRQKPPYPYLVLQELVLARRRPRSTHAKSSMKCSPRPFHSVCFQGRNHRIVS